MMVAKNQHIELIAKGLKSELPHYWSATFQRPANFVFEAGDWIDIEFENMLLAGGKTYSIASSPTESDIMITFRDGLSELKKALAGLQPNAKLIITQYGNDYGFQLKKNQPSVLIAGGVGIAPFRSIIKEMVDNGDSNQVTLIYLNQTEDFLFKSELDLWAQQMPNLSIIYIATKAINRKKREQLIRSLVKDTNQNFYIAGPPGMVESNEHLLLDMGVQLRDIRIDSFGGY